MGLKAFALSGIVALAAIMIMMKTEKVTHANQDPSFELHGETLTPSNCYSETYFEARDKFRQAAAKAGAELYSILIQNDDYTTDIAILKGNRSGIVVHSSGVHGVEGYAGSAIQVAWMNHYHGHHKENLPTMILVHAINPYGMAHFHRTNENNVDLNRNALQGDGWKAALGRDPNIAHYEEFVDMFNPPKVQSFWVSAIPRVVQHGVRKLKKAMITGQYHRPEGIFYGGNQMEKSWQELHSFLHEQLKTLDSDKSAKVTWIDVHTGLGKYGEDTILLGFDETYCTPREVATVFEGSTFPGLDADGDDVKDGYDLVVGDGKPFVQALFDHGEARDVLALIQEFGTVHSVLVGRSLVIENTIRQHDPDQKELGQKLMKAAFYVRKKSWRKSILTKGIKVLRQAIERVNSEPKSNQ